MKSIRVLSVAFIVLLSLPVFAQDCKLYFPEYTGAVREMTNFNKKDKITGRVSQTILDKQVSGEDILLTVKTRIINDEDELVNESEVDIRCENGIFKVDMSESLHEMLKAYESMEIEIKGDPLEIPNILNMGDKLPDGKVNIKVKSNGLSFVNMDVIIQNRKVEAKEKITTSAGSFDCYKISYETVSEMRIMTIKTKAVEWISEGVGVVKTENYDKKGKLSSYSLLTRFK